MSKDIMQPNVAFDTIFRIERITGKPLRRGFDTILNEILDDYESLKKKSRRGSKK